ncbi:MAG TPA: NAD(P)H-dependent oxidoreductase [Lacunisphaera sp.]|nr:NAD(P)H-dependent oxidoreductase [Lacunisphaera sp.]
MILVLSTSLNPDSNSRLLAHETARFLGAEGVETEFLDLREHPLPFCDGGAAYAQPEVKTASELIARADAIVVATPIYNYTINAALKNLVELTGGAWENKVVAFLCAAGGNSSYMSIMGLANSLMLDFRCLVVPRFVYATGRDFSDGRIASTEVRQRVADLARATHRLTKLPSAA